MSEEKNNDFVHISEILPEILRRYENYDPKKDWAELYKEAETYFEKLQVIRDYYIDNEQQIINLAIKDIRKSYNIYAFEWVRFFTRIEMDAWQCIRCAGITMYPQYPALNYFLDFANPYLKIALEMDGKDFHDPAKDMIRDNRLYREQGWKVFRVTGSEAVRQVEMPGRYPSESHYDFIEKLDQLYHFMNDTVDGVVQALKYVYFLPLAQNTWEDIRFNEMCRQTLLNHRLADFSL